MDNEDGATARCERPAPRCEIDFPPVIVDQRVRNEANVRKIREKFKERVARRGDQDFVSGFA